MTKPALLVMDVQRAVVHRYPDPEYLSTLADGIAAARASSVPVIYVVVGFRPGYPEISNRNKMFGGLAGTPSTPEADEAMAIHPAIAPGPDDIVVTKRRVSAFSGSDLEMVLRVGEIDHLVLSGIATSGVVLSTLREAADLDYGLTVLSDGCLDNDPEVHRLLLKKVFPQQAEVMSIVDWIGSVEP